LDKVAPGKDRAISLARISRDGGSRIKTAITYLEQDDIKAYNLRVGIIVDKIPLISTIGKT
jgi:hypothetical protein